MTDQTVSRPRGAVCARKLCRARFRRLDPLSGPALLNDLAGFREKGDRHHLCEAPSGPFRQMVPVTFLPPRIVQRYLALAGFVVGTVVLLGCISASGALQAAEPPAPAPGAQPAQPGGAPGAAAGYDSIAIDPQQQANWARNAGSVKSMLRDARFQEGEQEVFDRFFLGYYLPRWSDPNNVTALTEYRDDLEIRYLRTAKPGPPCNRLNELILAFLATGVPADMVPAGLQNEIPPGTALAKGNFHPAVRVNAMLMVGRLNVAGGNPPVPWPQALPAMVVAVRDPQQIDGVRVAALIGILRHAESGIADPDARAALADMAADLAAAATPPPGRTPEGHAWTRMRAIEILGTMGWVGNATAGNIGEPVAKLLSDMAADPQLDIWLRCAAARALGGLQYQGAGGLDPDQLVRTFGRLTIDVVAAEDQPVSRRRLKYRLASVWYGLMGKDWAPSGSRDPEPGRGVAHLATSTEQRALLDPVRDTLDDMMIALDTRSVDQTALTDEVNRLTADLETKLRPTP